MSIDVTAHIRTSHEVSGGHSILTSPSSSTGQSGADWPCGHGGMAGRRAAHGRACEK